MASIQRHVGEVQSLRISFISCDCLQEDVTLFDASNPGGKYKVSTGILYVLELYRMLMININSILHILFYFILFHFNSFLYYLFGFITHVQVNLKEPYGQMVIEECMYLANFRYVKCILLIFVSVFFLSSLLISFPS